MWGEGHKELYTPVVTSHRYKAQVFSEGMHTSELYTPIYNKLSYILSY